MNLEFIKSIKTDEDYEAALNRAAAIMSASPGTEERAEMDVLYDLIEHYEDRHYRIDPPSPSKAILFRLEQGGVSLDQLEGLFGGADPTKEVLSGRRGLTAENVLRLHTEFGIPLESLLSQPLADAGPAKKSRSIAERRSEYGRKDGR